MFNLADKFQCPGIVLTDLLLSEGTGSADPAELDFNVGIDRGELLTSANGNGNGANGHYNGSYSDTRLSSWASWLLAQQDAGADVYVYFNNDVGGHAPRNALTLRRLMEEPNE